ncbi:flagellin N-terminal helical domain-containing protein [Neobacillus sp. M.A.Huq-85]
MIINHNITALNTYRQLNTNSNAQAKSMAKLSSGLRINSAADDAAGLSISEKMKGQIRGLDQASRNAQDGISLVSTAEGALNETHDILQRMRELSTQASNGTATDSDRGAMQDEFNQLTSEINRIGNTTEFNTQKLLNGGIGSNSGDKITQATSASLTLSGATTNAASTSKITVDNLTFDLSSAGTLTGSGAASDITALGNVTSGGTKLSDVVDITQTASGVLTFTAKSQGANSTITLDDGGADDAGLGAVDATDAKTVHGTSTTVERTGVEMTTALGGGNTIAANSSFQVTVGSNSAVTVNIGGPNGKTYDTGNSDSNVAKAAMQDLVKDVNAALQQAGLSGQVTASLSDTNKLQFISETGKDISLTDGTGTPLAAMGSTAATDVKGNIQQVVGPGAQGVGYNVKFQIGANTGQSMSLTINDMRSSALGITGNAGQQGFTTANSVSNGTDDIKTEAALNISSVDDASKTIAVIDKAIQTVSAERSKLGAVQNRLDHTINNLNTSSQNITDAQSRISDVDMAKEMMNQTKSSVLAQAAQAMLAQANQQPQQVLQLLRG